jgi:ankyrin repeat protein
MADGARASDEELGSFVAHPIFARLRACVLQADVATRLIEAAITSENADVGVLHVLVALGADVNNNKDGETPLCMASEKGHAEVVKMLLGAGADVNKAATDDGATPLWTASYHGHAEVVKMLLSAGADVNKARTMPRRGPSTEPLPWLAGVPGRAVRGRKPPLA